MNGSSRKRRGIHRPGPSEPCGHGLLLLMANLAQLDDPQVIKQLFIGALSRIFDNVEIRAVESGETEADLKFEIATARRSFGAVTARTDGREFDKQTLALLQNAVHMVALILENLANRRTAERERDNFFDISDDLLCVTDTEGQFLQVNPAWKKTLGWSRGDLQEKPFMDFVHPDDVDVTLEAMGTLSGGDAVHDFQNRCRCRDGTYRWLEWTSILDHGKLYAAARDVTDRQRAEEALRESEARFSKAFLVSPAALAITRAGDGSYHDVNRMWLSILGYSRDEVIGKTSVDLGIWDDLGQRAAFIDRIRREGSAHGFEAVFVTKDDRRRTIVLAAEPLEIAGEPCLLGAFYDITERKAMERALRESEERFRRLYEESPLPYQSLDIKGRLVEVNQAWLDLSGYRHDEVIGRWFGDFLPEKDRAALERNFARFIEVGEIHDPVYEMIRKDGSTRMVAVDGRVGRDMDGQFSQTHCIMTDVTERLRVEERLRQAQKMEAVGQLAGGTAHDFNNLLQVVMSNLDLLSRMIGEEDRGQILVENALKAVRRGARLTQQLLSFSGGRCCFRNRPSGRVDPRHAGYAGAHAGRGCRD